MPKLAAECRLSTFDFKFATGVSKQQIQELSALTFIERNERIKTIAAP
ncbi:ATP-binding protein [Vibrio metschnikovii]